MTDEAFLTDTRNTYDTVAESYAERVPRMDGEHPVHRGTLDAFATLVRDSGPVADVGCGTGRITGYLHELGLDVFGIDLSPGMLAVARREHPDVRFREGSMLDLDLETGSLGGLLAWYSVIHVPEARIPGVFADFHRVLRPGGYLQLGFHVGTETSHKTEGYGHEGISLDVHRRPVDHVCALLTDAGFVLDTRVIRESEDPQRAQGAFVLVRKG